MVNLVAIDASNLSRNSQIQDTQICTADTHTHPRKCHTRIRCETLVIMNRHKIIRAQFQFTTLVIVALYLQSKHWLAGAIWFMYFWAVI